MQTLSGILVSNQQRPPEDIMFSSRAIRQFAAYSASLPTFAAPPALAKETVYMPSRLAALVLGRGPVDGVVIRSGNARPVVKPIIVPRESAA
jgi:hypothetical protein